MDPTTLKPYSQLVAEVEALDLPQDLKDIATARLKNAITDHSGLSNEQKVRLAHDKVFRLHPIALAAVAARWKVRFIENTPDGLPVQTMSTDGRCLNINPAFVEGLTLGMATCIVLHEVCHVVLSHHFRFGKLAPSDHELANDAADLEINSRLLSEYLRVASPVEVGFLLENGKFPRQGSYSHLPNDKSFEWYFAELRKQREQDRQQRKQDQQDRGEGSSKGQRGKPQPGFAPSMSDGPGEDNLDQMMEDIIDRAGQEEDKPSKPGKSKGEDSNTGSGSDDGDDDDSDEGDGDEPGEGSEGRGKGNSSGDDSDDGDGQDGGQGDGGGEGDSPGNIFGKVEPYSLDEDESEEGERHFKEAVTAAIVTDKSWSDGTGWLETMLQDTVLPTDPDAEKLNWKQMLRDFLSKVCPEGYSYTRPSRRHGHRRDVILPAHRSLGTANGLLIVDTSGSMGDAECNAALNELEEILSEYPRATVRVISCDKRVIMESNKVYTRDDFPLLEPTVWKGRGGTDLSPAFLYAQEIAAEIDWVLCLTDMEWKYTAAPNPGKPTIWLSTRGDAQRWNETIPFGTHAQVVI